MAAKMRVMSAKQVYDYLGGNIGRDKVIKLMKDGVIKSAWLGKKLVADALSVELFATSLFSRCHDQIIDSVPIVYINDKAKKAV